MLLVDLFSEDHWASRTGHCCLPCYGASHDGDPLEGAVQFLVGYTHKRLDGCHVVSFCMIQVIKNPLLFRFDSQLKCAYCGYRRVGTCT